MPRFSNVPSTVEKVPANRVEPIRISGPKRSTLTDTYPGAETQSDGRQSLIKFEVEPPAEVRHRNVRLVSPPEPERPSNEVGEILRLGRPVRDRSEQGQSYDYPTAEIRTAPASEVFEKLDQFSVKEWSAGRSMSPDRIQKTNRKRSAPDSFAVLPASPKESPEPSSSIPGIRPMVQDRPAVKPESLPEVGLQDRFSSVRFPTPQPMTKSPSPAPKKLQEKVSHSSVDDERTLSLRADNLTPRPGNKDQRSLSSQSQSLEHLSPEFITSPLIPIRHSEPLPELNVLTDWPGLFAFETEFHHADVNFPLPGLHPPLEPKSSEAPAESPRHPQLPALPIHVLK